MAKESSDDAEAAAGGKKKMIGMVAGGLIVVGAAYNFVLKPSPEPTPEELAMAAEVEPVEGEIFELPEMVVNLEDDEVQYVRFAAALILEEGTLAADFGAESAIAQDVVLEVVSSKSADDLRPANRQALKEELSTRIREAYGDEKVVRALITTLVMQ